MASLEPALWIVYILLCFSTSFLVSLAVIFSGLVDQPIHRSSHEKAVPTSGGLALAAGLSIGFLSLYFFFDMPLNVFSFLGSALLFSLFALIIGLIDDLLTLRAGWKFLLLALLSVGASIWVEPVLLIPFTNHFSLSLSWFLGLILTSLWFFVILNFVNFMDGANGLMLSVMFSAFAILGLIGFQQDILSLLILSCGMMSVLSSLLFFNFRKKAKLFSGDSGAFFISMMFAYSTVYFANHILDYKTEMKGVLYVFPILIFPFLIDPSLTLFWRLSKKRPLLQGHREHFYQLAIRSGYSHLQVSALYMLLTYLLSMIALYFGYRGVIDSLIFLIICIILFSIIAFFIRKKAVQFGYETPY